MKYKGTVYNKTKNWCKNINSHFHMISICSEECDLDDELYVTDYETDDREWTTPRKMGYARYRPNEI